MPPDAFALLDVPSFIALAVAGALYGALVVWQAPAFRLTSGSVLFTTFLAVAFMAVFFTFLIAFRAYADTPTWGKTIGTAIQGLVFAGSIGLGLGFRKRFA